jgi:hypothetical protein
MKSCLDTYELDRMRSGILWGKLTMSCTKRSLVFLHNRQQE